MERRKYQPRRSKTIAALIAFFFGSLGLQKFYLRQYPLAIMMLVMSVVFLPEITGLFAIIGLFDAVRLLMMSQDQFDRRYNRYASANRRDDYRQDRRRRRSDRKSGSRAPSKAPAARSRRVRSNPFKTSGLRKYKDFELEGAIEDFVQGLEISPDDVALHFNLACAYSLTEEKDKAYQHLSRAVELGYKDFNTIDTKEDLAFVRIQPEYESFKAGGFKLGNMRASGKSTTASVQQSQPEQQPEQQPMDDVLLSQLNKLDQLRKKGLLSDAEFDLERKKLLRRQ